LLSERRVNAIRDALVLAGVPGDKIKTGAFGEQHQLCHQSTEACWQSERRVESGRLIGSQRDDFPRRLVLVAPGRDRSMGTFWD